MISFASMSMELRNFNLQIISFVREERAKSLWALAAATPWGDVTQYMTRWGLYEHGAGAS